MPRVAGLRRSTSPKARSRRPSRCPAVGNQNGKSHLGRVGFAAMNRTTVFIKEGDVFGKLIALRPIGKSHHWLCRCQCGREKGISKYSLNRGLSKSCGCQPKKPARHGHSRKGFWSPEYRAWAAMLARCRDLGKNAAWYRDVSVCDRWAHSFENFLTDMGLKPGRGYSIDRIDSLQGYSPGNCRWATPKQQARNKRNAFKDGGVPLADLSDATGIKYKTLRDRYVRGDRGARLIRPINGKVVPR